MSIFKNDGYNIARPPPIPRQTSDNSFKWRPTLEVEAEVQKAIEPAEKYLENLDKNQSDGEYDSHESEEQDYVKEDENINKMKTYLDMDNEEEEKIEESKEIPVPVNQKPSSTSSKSFEPDQSSEEMVRDKIIVNEENQSEEWSDNDGNDSVKKPNQGKELENSKESLSNKNEEEDDDNDNDESQSEILVQTSLQQDKLGENSDREVIELEDSIDINDDAEKEPVDYKENESITDSDMDINSKYNIFNSNALPKDSVSRDLEFTYENPFANKYDYSGAIIHKNRFEYEFQKKQGYLRDLSKEKKQKNFSNLLLTPNNRQRKIGYMHQSRENSIDRSAASKRGVGIGF